ncbi:MAG: VOC family protein [Actinomycetales bacterium]|nr:VOC family protein [Actinomycetales bacterium]
MTTVTPFLWYDSELERAIERYGAVFGRENVRLVEATHHDDAGPGTPRTLFFATFEVFGQRVMGMNAGPQYPQTEAFSFFVLCPDDQDVVDRYWEGLVADGGAESMCGWLKDPWGVSWQIVPEALMRLQADPDRAAAERVRQAMLGMGKIVIAELEAAFRGE